MYVIFMAGWCVVMNMSSYNHRVTYVYKKIM